jgi:carboxyl-terminal processing protease
MFRAIVLVSFALGVNAWGGQTPVHPNAVAPVSPAQTESDADARRRDAFEIVWRAVKDYHFDPTYGGVDWDAVHAEFAPRVARTVSDRELHLLLQEMLNRLGRSHFVIIPPESIPAFAPEESDADEPDTPAPPLSPQGLNVTERLTNGIGIDLRILNGAVVITRVEPQSSAARAGLRPGFIVRSVDGRLLSSVLWQMKRASVYQPVVRHQLPTELVVGLFNGPAGTSARISYLDALNRPHRVSVPRARLKGEMSPPIQSLPPLFVEFEARRLPQGIGYIRFNLFAVPVLEKFCTALRTMADAPGMIIDLRGNRGGVLGVLYGMGGLLETRAVSLGSMRTRDGALPFVAIPQKHVYTGQLVVLIDDSTQSAGEMLASGLQETGRAVVVGERSAGATLPSIAKELPTGAILQYAFADFHTPRGNLIEGHGVQPDITVKLDRRTLLAGHDAQLEAAVNIIQPRVPMPAFVPSDEGVPDEMAAPPNAAPTPTPAPNDPLVEQIIDRYVQAIGGRAVVERISSRVAKGAFSGSFAGIAINGTVEIIEQAPDKSISLITIPSVGVIRRAFTGAYGYEQIPLFGFRSLKGPELANMRRTAMLHWSISLRQLYPQMTLKGQEQIGAADTYVVAATPVEGGRPTMLYFDTKTGLLLREDGIYFEDYREVDGLMYPFTVRSANDVIKLTEVRHNVAVSDASFVEQQDCFTR